MGSLTLWIMLAVANATGAGMIVPQVVRLSRLKETRGLSGVWVGVGIALNGWWLAYSVQSQLWGITPVSLFSLMLYSTIAWQLTKIAGTTTLHSIIKGILGVGLLPLPFLLTAGWSTVGLVIGLCYAVQFAPAAASAIRSTNIDGISPMTWIMAAIEAIIWCIYGAAVTDTPLLIGGGGGALMSLIILFRLATSTKASKTAQSTF